MDRLLYNAAVGGYKNLPAAIAVDNDDDFLFELEGEDNICDEWRNLEAGEEYYMRKTRGKNNILHLSVQLQHFAFAEKAARRFPQLISEVNADGNNSLHVAAEIGNVDFVKLFVGLYKEKIKNEQSPPWMGKNKEGNTPLHVALIYGKIKLACYLVELDPSLACICNHSQEAPLHLALRHRVDYDQQIVRGAMKLVTNMQNVKKSKKKGCCKLEKNSMPIVELLLEKESSMAYWQDNEGITPPLLAATLNPPYAQAIHAILEHYPESLEECDDFGNNILHLMTPLSTEINMDAFKVLMGLFSFSQISALKNKRNKDGNTPAHMAIKNHNIELIAILIKFSANLAIKNKKGVSAANLIQQCSEEFQTLVKNKIEFMDNEESRNYESLWQDDTWKIEFSIESIKEKKMLHKTTTFGNILHTWMYRCPNDMKDNEVKEFIKELLSMAPKLICQLNSHGQTALHFIAQYRPSLIDKDFREMINHFYKLIKEEEDVEEFSYDPPWTVKDMHGNTILHLALSNHLPARWLYQILKFDYNFAMQVNNKGELPLHILLKKVFHPDYKRTYADKVALTKLECMRSLHTYNKRASHIADKEGLTPLFIAAQVKEFKCFNELLSQHAYHHSMDDIKNCHLKSTYDGDPDGNTFWHHLAHVHDDAVIFDYPWGKYCSNASNALTQCNMNGKTPFHIAIENGNFEVAYLYFSKTLPDDKRHLVYKDMGDKDGNVPLHLVVGRSNLPFAQEFIQDVTTPTELIAVHNNMGLTPLHLAVLKQDIQFFNIIFDLERDDKAFTRQILQITDRDHNTLLHYAISQGPSIFAEMFFNKGVWAECIDEILDMSNKDGNGPLHLAVLRGDSSLATKFIDRAKENNFIQGMLDKNNNEGNTPTHLAIQNREFNLVKGFIQYAIESSCINKILYIPNNKDETPGSLIGSVVHLPIEFENFFWNEPKVVEAMLGVRSLSGVPTKMIKEYTNTIGVIAALLATITFTAGFTVPGGLNNSNGTPLLMQKPEFQVFMVSDIIAMCLSMMVLFFLMWIMTINDEKHQVILVDLTVFSLQGAFYATILTFMTGLYASVFPSAHWIAIFACVLCSLLILLVHKRLIIWFIPGFIHIYVWYQKVKKLYGHMLCCCFNKN